MHDYLRQALGSERLRYFVLFVLVSCLFHYRAFTEGALLAPYNDAIAQNYPVKHLYGYALRSHQFPLWNPYEFAGLPFLGEIQNGVLYPVNLVLYYLLDAPYAYNASYILHFALAGFFTFVYLRQIGLGRMPSFAAGLVFGFSGFMLVNKDHTAIVNSAAYLPLIMYLLERLREGPRLRLSLKLSLAVAVQFLAGNFQVSVYTYMVMGVFLVYYGLKNEEGRGARTFVLGLSGIAVGLALASPQIYATWELSGLSWMRARELMLGYGYFVGYSLYTEMLASLFFPHLFDGWAPEGAMTIYLGILPVTLAAVSAMALFKFRHHARFWTLVALMGLFLAIGSDNPLYVLLYRVPLYNMIRAHGRHLMEFTFAVSVLFGMGLHCLLYERQRVFIRGTAIALLAVMAVSGALLFFIGLLPVEGLLERLGQKGYGEAGYIMDALRFGDRDVYVPLAMMALYLLWLAAFGGIRRPALGLALLGLVALEVFGIGGYQGRGGPAIAEARDLMKAEPYYSRVMTDKEPGRVVNVVPREHLWRPEHYNPTANLTARVGSVTGFDPLVLSRYSDALGLTLSGKGSLAWRELLQNNIALSMLGGKYIKLTKGMQIELDGVRSATAPPARTRLPGFEWELSGGAAKSSDLYFLYTTDKRHRAGLHKTLRLQKGVYALFFSLRGSEGATGQLAFSIRPDKDDSGSGFGFNSVLLIPADWLGSGYREFNRVFVVPESGNYTLAFLRSASGPVELKDISLQRFQSYGPPAMAAGRGGAVYAKLGEDGHSALYLNRNALPRAWSVRRLVTVADGFEAARRVNFLQFNPREEAMLEGVEVESPGAERFSEGDVFVEGYSLNSLSLRTEFPAMGFVVLSEQHYPGWRAYVDGRETSIYRVNGFLRGVAVPGGKHQVLFRYRPGAVFLFGLGSLVLLGAILAYLVVSGGGGREIAVLDERL